MFLMTIIFALFLGYILGSVPFGLIFAKALGHGDLRKIGSGNIGANNALRTGDKKLAILTLFFDLLKGIIPVLILKEINPAFISLAGFGAVLGHCYPIWLNFKGGKGVATAFGVFLAINPLLGVLSLTTWLIMAFLFKISSVSSLSAVLGAPIYAYFLLTDKIAMELFFITIIVWIRHKENIIKLMHGKETKIGKKK